MSSWVGGGGEGMGEEEERPNVNLLAVLIGLGV